MSERGPLLHRKGFGAVVCRRGGMFLQTKANVLFLSLIFSLLNCSWFNSLFYRMCRACSLSMLSYVLSMSSKIRISLLVGLHLLSSLRKLNAFLLNEGVCLLTVWFINGLMCLVGCMREKAWHLLISGLLDVCLCVL